MTVHGLLCIRPPKTLLHSYHPTPPHPPHLSKPYVICIQLGLPPSPYFLKPNLPFPPPPLNEFLNTGLGLVQRVLPWGTVNHTHKLATSNNEGP